MCSSCTVDAGAVGGAACIGKASVSSSRPCLVKTIRRSVTRHSEHMKVWCSKRGTASRTTFIKINSAPHAAQRIACTLMGTTVNKRKQLTLRVEMFEQKPSQARNGNGCYKKSCPHGTIPPSQRVSSPELSKDANRA
jgi:hypothetical protein